MDVSRTLAVPDRAAWRAWLVDHHRTTPAVWHITYTAQTERPSVPYLHAVEEALCFGWIDGIAKRLDAQCSAQRFSPRRANSHWTELNKEWARRLIASGLMTDSGSAVLPDLDVASFRIPDDILATLQADPEAWVHFQQLPAVYQRVCVGYIEEMRRQPEVFHKRLNHFLRKTRQGAMFGTFE